MAIKIRELLNKIKWDPQLKEKDYLIVFIHRGSPNNCKTIEAKKIKNIMKNFFSYFDNDNYSFIPFHRISVIKEKKTNQILFQKK
ncbi:MAG: DUF504 domain-containing protein [Candidatus Helarchaeota archaeon]